MSFPEDAAKLLKFTSASETEAFIRTLCSQSMIDPMKLKLVQRQTVDGYNIKVESWLELRGPNDKETL